MDTSIQLNINGMLYIVQYIIVLYRLVAETYF